jgi:hypothetical protein
VFGTSVFIDPLDPNPSRRFKTLFDHIASPADSLWGPREVRAAHSPDGIHWTVYDQRPTCGTRGQLFDDIIVMTVDTEARQYVAYTRHSYRGDFAPNSGTPRTNSLWSPYYPYDPGRENRAGVWVSQSSDFLHWSEPRLILQLDENDNLDDQVYCLTPLNLGSHRVGLLNVLHTVENTIDVQLVHSRDGMHWQRAGQRQPFLECGAPGSWDESIVNVPSLPVRVEDELWIYYGGARNHHDWWFLAEDEDLDGLEARDRSLVGYAMGLAKLRLDGFVSLQAGPVREGILVTRPFVSDGTRLVINGTCGPGGYIDVEVMDINNQALPQRSRADCDTFRGDSVRHVVTWGEQSAVPVPSPPGILYQRAGSPYAPAGHRKLRFYMRNAHLFSFRLEWGHDAENGQGQSEG